MGSDFPITSFELGQFRVMTGKLQIIIDCPWSPGLPLESWHSSRWLHFLWDLKLMGLRKCGLQGFYGDGKRIMWRNVHDPRNVCHENCRNILCDPEVEG